jgi:O-antigen biosynthesis protein
MQCLYFLRMYTDLSDAEIIILDNGSSAPDFALLCAIAAATKVIRLDSNRGFGEGNNIAVDETRGKLLLFLNNDVFVSEGWLTPLVSVLENDPTVSAAGPKFLYPDGTLQEAGAMVASCGTALQRGKYMDGRFSLFDQAGPSQVDYCSAATLLVRADDFKRVLGFDLCWDPAYYEDADLCLKLRLLGQKTMYVPASKVFHIENGTSSDRRLNLQLHDVVAINRLKFVSRWSGYLSGLSDGADERRLLLKNAGTRTSWELPRLGIYTPYQLVPGGGERYLLSIAASLRGIYDCTLLTPERYSRARLQTMARELDLDLDHVDLAVFSDAVGKTHFAVFIAMGNEILPSHHGAGALNLYHCQFPFPLKSEHFAANWDKMKDYDGYIVNSEFTSHYVALAEKHHGFAPKKRYVLHPPVPQVDTKQVTSPRNNGPIKILNVGRFSPDGHCKRQDVMIEAFRLFFERSARPLELHLAGTLDGSSSSRRYLASLQQAARGLPVSFHVNILPQHIHDLYRQATIYWHLTGIESDINLCPELFEHFGISIVEAMSAGAIPITIGYGGPSEFITDGSDGFLISSVEELLDRTVILLSKDERDLTAMGDRAKERAAHFSISRFADRLREVLEDAGVRDMPMPAAHRIRAVPSLVA